MKPGQKWAAAALAALLLFAPGCDTLDTGEQVILEVEENFDFEFDAADLEAGPMIVSADVGNIEGQLSGFLKSEIVSAEVIEITLERGLPLGANLDDIMSSATVRLQAAEQNGIAVGSLTSLPADDTATLTPATAGVGAYLSAPSFQAVLQFAPAASIPDDFHRLTARITFRVEVEGL